MGKRKQVTIAKKVIRSNMAHAVFLGTLIMVVSMVMFLYGILNRSYENTVQMARTTSDILKDNADVPGLVDAVLSQERENPDFEAVMEKSNPADTEGQLLNYRWYTEEDPPLAQRADYKKVMSTIYTFNQNNSDLNGTSLMVFDKKTHIAALLCDVEKFGGKEAVKVEEVLWRRFEDVELDQIEDERWSIMKNFWRYFRIDPRYVVFAWYEPFPYPDENVVVFVEADAFYTHIWANIFSFLIVFIMLLLVIAYLMGLLYSRKMKKMIVDPINAVAEAARSYVLDRKNGVPLRQYFTELSLDTGDEFEMLSETMAEMEKEIETYEENLTAITAEKERIAAELNVAAKIQHDMLPQKFPLYPDRKEFDVFASMDPAKAVGGDFYDIFFIDDDHLALVMADVSGKGIPASLFMVVSKVLINNRAQMGGSPSEIISDVNKRLCEGGITSMFVTVWLAILTLSTGEVVETNAGHEIPYILKRGENDNIYEGIDIKHDFVVGGLERAKYHEDSFVIKPGDQLFIYTDGVTEANNKEEARYGMDRLKAVLDRNHDAMPQELLKKVREDIDLFTEGADQFDDLTMLSFIFYGKQK